MGNMGGSCIVSAWQLRELFWVRHFSKLEKAVLNLGTKNPLKTISEHISSNITILHSCASA